MQLQNKTNNKVHLMRFDDINKHRTRFVLLYSQRI